MSNNYLTVCDLDDTLLTTNKIISESSKNFINEYVKRGNYFIICTGRPYSGAIQYWNLLPNNMPMVCDNGASIYFRIDNQIKFQYFDIDLTVFKKFLKEVDEYILSGVSTVYNEIMVQNIKEVPSWIIHHELPNMKIKEGKLSDLIDKNPLLPNLWIKKDYIEHFQLIIDKYKDVFTYRNWGLYEDRYSFEIFSINASKGKALEYLRNLYKIDKQKTCAFGDQWNDLSMIEVAHYGVSMINGVQILKDNSKYQTTYDNNNDGVIRYIKDHNLY